MPRPPGSPPLEVKQIPENVQSTEPVQGKSHTSSKHLKKLKKHAKLDSLEGQISEADPVTKPKRHKKSHVDKTASTTTVYPPVGPEGSNEHTPGMKRTEAIDTPVEVEEPVKKKKKRSKDHHQSKSEKSKNKKAAAAAAVVAAVTDNTAAPTEETCSTEAIGPKSKSNSKSKDRSKTNKDVDNLAPQLASTHKSHAAEVHPVEHEGRSRRISTDTSDVPLCQASPDQENPPSHSPRHSSHSSRFSSARSSSYSRSPSHHVPDRRGDVRPYRQKYTDRGSRYRAPDRSRSPDPRQFQPRRTYVAYRPPSTGRDSSYEDYGHESRPPRFRHSRSHSRSRGLSRHGCETAGREYDMSQPSTRPPRDASPRRNGTRRHYRDEPERPRDSPPRRPLKRDRPTDERHPRPELSMSDNRHGRPYRPRERAHGDHFPSPEHAVQPIHESRRERSPERRPRHREPIRPMDSERRMARADKPRISPSRCAPRQSTRSDHRSREERDTSRKQHDSEENNKPERHPRRPSMNEDRLSTEHNTPTESSSGTTNAVSTAGSRAHKRSTASRSPRSSKRDSGSGKSHAPTAPTSSVSSKLRPVQEHLDQLQFEAVSDTELETMLTPAVFLTTTSPAKDTAGTELTDLASGEQGLVESGQNKENKETLPTSSDAAADSAVTTDASKTNETKGEESTALVLDALDKISSQLKQKLSGPETWDIGAGSESEIEDDVGLGGLDLFADQSVIGLTTSKTGWSTRSRQLTASLNAPWQRLVESATKELAPMDLAMENKMNDRDFIQPAVCVGTPLNPQGSSFPRRLVSLQRRASGAACLSQIGISSRYLGSELRTELIHLVQEQLSTEDADKSELTSSAPEIDTIGSHTVAWMDRTRDIFASCGQDLPRLWFESAINFGILSGKSDHTVRRLLLQGTT